MKKLSLIVAQKLRQLFVGWCSLDCRILLTADTTQPETSSDKEPANRCALLERIVGLMEIEKLFKNPQLDLKHLSERLEAPAYLVTKAINEQLGINFNDLINRYRVDEVKKLLTLRDSKRFTLMAIAFDAGFNSKTTFNTVFKKSTGVTPSYYRDQYCGAAVPDYLPKVNGQARLCKLQRKQSLMQEK